MNNTMTLDVMVKAAERGEIVRKTLDAPQLKAIDDDGSGGFTAYASTFGNVDRQMDRMMKGAFAEDLPRFLRDGFIALGHDWDSMGIGYPVDAYEDDYGLFLKAAFHSDAEAQAVRKRVSERLAAGKSVSTSVGFFVRDYAIKDGIFEITKAELHEVSLVTIPANPQALVVGSKGGFASDIEAAVQAAQKAADRALARYEARAKESRELSAANVAMLDDAVKSLNEIATKLGELAERNRKGLASEPNRQAEAAALIARFHAIDADYQLINHFTN